MIEHIEKMAKSNPRVAQIPTINPWVQKVKCLTELNGSQSWGV